MMRFVITSAAAALLAVAAPAYATDSLFARLVKASLKNDRASLARVLSTETISASTGQVLADNRVNGGAMRHGVSSNELARKLVGCAVKECRDAGNEQGPAYILWKCPTRRAPENQCYFYSYRAEMLDPRYHPANLLVSEKPTWDARCGARLVAPPMMPKP